jgi:hypothetical protein
MLSIGVIFLWLFTTPLANKMGLSEFWQYFQRETEFHALETDSHYGNEEDVESEELLTKGRLARKSALPRAWICLTIANVIILSITIFLVFTATRSLPSNEKNAVLRPISWWCKSPLPRKKYFSKLTRLLRIIAPILDDIEIPRYTTTLNGTLFALPEVSVAREEPSADNDVAWAQYEKVLTHVVTREQIIKLGKDPRTVARFNDEYWGMGDDAYMVQLDVMHVRSLIFLQQRTESCI